MPGITSSITRAEPKRSPTILQRREAGLAVRCEHTVNAEPDPAELVGDLYALGECKTDRSRAFDNRMSVTKTTKKTIAVLVATILMMTAVGTTRAQVGPEMNDVRTAEGMIVHGPVGGQYFRMQLRGKDTGRMRTKKKYWYRVDGVRLEFFSEDKNNFVMTNVPKALDDRVVLDLYRSDYLRHFAGSKPPNWRTAWIKLASGKTALFWSYRKDAATP